MPDGAGLARLVDASAILSAEQQAHVAALHGEDSWAVEVAASSVVLTAPDGTRLACRAHLLGTSAPGPRTWLWGWQNINGFPAAFVALAEQVRAAGEQQGLPELTTAELPLDDALPRRLTIAAKTVTGLPLHYSSPIGGGSRAWLLIEHPGLELPEPSARRTADAILAAIDGVVVTDHMEALASWARQRGVSLREEHPGERHAPEVRRLALPDGDVLVTVDEHGRISRVEARAAVGLDAAALQHAGGRMRAGGAGAGAGNRSRGGTGTGTGTRTGTGTGLASDRVAGPAERAEPVEPVEPVEPAAPIGQQPESTMRRLLGLLLGPKP